MDPTRDLLELSILYDTARGFLGLRDRGSVIDTALLSLMGACGARFAVYLEREDDLLVRRAAQGEAPGSLEQLRITSPAEKALDRTSSPLLTSDPDALGARFGSAAARQGLEVLAPVRRSGAFRHVIALGPKLLGEPYNERDLAVAREILGQLSLALGPSRTTPTRSRSRAEAVAEIREFHEQNPALRSFRGASPATAALLSELVALAEFDLPVLVLGETGTGKELVAHAVHDLSRRQHHAFEPINCAAIPRDLMASALFGHEKGAFTGADTTVHGAFERAGEGTIFLDEIGDMPLDTQAMLLRVLEERGFHRVGGTAVIQTRARVISATNRDLLTEVEEGRFRRDLFYRLQMYTVRVQPLRERREDIPPLVAHLLAAYHGKAKAESAPTAAADFLAALQKRALKGNVRELESLIAGAVVQGRGAAELKSEHLPADDGTALGTVRALEAPGSRARHSPAPDPSLARSTRTSEAAWRDQDIPAWADMERNYILSVLELTGGNRQEAARIMGIPRTTLNSKIQRFGIVRT